LIKIVGSNGDATGVEGRGIEIGGRNKGTYRDRGKIQIVCIDGRTM
jgi:hypothetical protein